MIIFITDFGVCAIFPANNLAFSYDRNSKIECNNQSSSITFGAFPSMRAKKYGRLDKKSN